MKNRIIISLIGVLFCAPIVSQNFTYLHNTTDNATFQEIVELDSGYVIIKNQKGQQAQPSFIWLNKKGEVVKDSLDLAGSGWWVQNIIKQSSNKLILVEKQVQPSEGKVRVKVINQQFNVSDLFNFEIGDYKLNLYASRLLQDSILAITGAILQDTSAHVSDGFVYFLNLNSSKDTLIDLSTPNSLWDFTTDIAYLGKKYYITASRTDFTPRPNCLSFAAVIRLNTDFSVDTIVPICNSISAKNGYDLFYVINIEKINPSSFFLSGRTDVGDAGYNPQVGLIKWDTNFNELNTVAFGKKDSFALETLEDIGRYESDSFVFVGGTENFTVNPSGFDTIPSYFMLTKADLNGDVLWTKYYFNNTYLQMYKVLATSDGGAIMAGTSYNHRTANGLENDIWVVKVDKNGNVDTTTSIIENGKIPKDDFIIFPNPASDYITFRQLNVQRNYQMELYNIQGKLLYETKINQAQKQIDLSAYSKGVYIYRLRDEKGNQLNGKILKE